MIIDTKRAVFQIQTRRFLTLVILVVLIIIVLLTNWIKPIKWLDRNQLAGVLSTIYVLSTVIEAFRELHYIYFSNQDEMIVLRYFSLGFFNKKKQVIQISLKSFSNYEIYSSLFGFRKKLVLMQKIKDNVAKYPAVSITLLSAKEIEMLEMGLKKHVQI